MGWGRRSPRGRRRAGLTQRDAAQRLGVSVDSVRAWEQGRRLPRAVYRQAAIDWGGDPEALLSGVDHCPNRLGW
ncbi:MAG: helix-turn-helix domain-containing protein [Isosphaeraceae bacterium]|nr:helix-turn-helix domain-containing protein [Isosphaeraceae bacterium]